MKMKTFSHYFLGWHSPCTTRCATGWGHLWHRC